MTEAQIVQTLTAPGSSAPGSLHLFTYSDRFVDTRDGTGLPGGTPKKLDAGAYPNGTSHKFQLSGVTGSFGQVIPPGATAVQGTITATRAKNPGFLSVLSGDVDFQPDVVSPKLRAIIAFQKDLPICNHFIVPLCPCGTIQVVIFLSAGVVSQPEYVDVVVDVAGYYTR